MVKFPFVVVALTDNMHVRIRMELSSEYLLGVYALKLPQIERTRHIVILSSVSILFHKNATIVLTMKLCGKNVLANHTSQLLLPSQIKSFLGDRKS